MKNWILQDNIPGAYNQAVALAEMMGWSFESKPIHYKKISKLPNILNPLNKVNIIKNFSELAQEPAPKIIISAGRKAAIVALQLKKHFNDKVKIIQIMHPNTKLSNFDIIILPYHDRKTFTHYTENILFIDGAICHLDEKKIKDEMKSWKAKLSPSKKPIVSVIIGGNSKHCHFKEAHIKDFVKSIISNAKHLNAKLLISTSRRTPVELTKALLKHLKSNKLDYFFYEYSQDSPNPYLAMLGYANYIITTADSISMNSEAISTGKPVYIYHPEGMVKSYKITRFLHELLFQDMARFLSQHIEPFTPQYNDRLGNFKEHLTNKIKRLLHETNL